MIKLGLDRLQEEDFRSIRGKRIGLMTNPSAVDSRLVSAYDVFRQAKGSKLAAFFGAEHGVKASIADGDLIHSSIDALTGLPVFSLYGSTFRPSPEMLEEIEVMVCDIQDMGARYYTFLWTISHIIEACGEAGIPVLILDRPNPLGAAVRGRGLDAQHASLVGRYDIPIQHGMTLGEMLSYLNARHNPQPAALRVMSMEGWKRAQFWHETGLAFVPPSPNMPHPVTAYHYPGACLVEGTNLSEGRGTPLPFEIVGAPFLDGAKLAHTLNAADLSGVRFRAHHFRPSASKYVGESCEGVQAHITDLKTYEPLKSWLSVIREIRHLYPGQFEWKPHFERLIGSDSVRDAIDAGAEVSEIMAGWDAYCSRFQDDSAEFLIYR
jgi:uncharacterized protein YbbC (DUF1343 family)